MNRKEICYVFWSKKTQDYTLSGGRPVNVEHMLSGLYEDLDPQDKLEISMCKVGADRADPDSHEVCVKIWKPDLTGQHRYHARYCSLSDKLSDALHNLALTIKMENEDVLISD